jgi:RNA polymerase sigma-70 factor (ECF subfamily)
VIAEWSDEALVERAQAGDLNAFETLVSRYERRIWALAKQMLQHDQDAEDVVQDTFLTALEHLHALRHGERFGAWLKQIATRLAYRVLAKRKRMPTESLDALLSEDPDEEETMPPRPQLVADWRDSPEALLQRKETMRLIEEALQQLPEKYRVVFWLRDVEQLSTRETAEALGISEANVKVRLLRARLMLREYLTRLFGADAEQILTHND